MLIYSQQQIQNERLTVPHVGVLERDFVLIPLLDLDPNLVVNDQLIKDLDIVQQSDLTVLANESWVNI